MPKPRAGRFMGVCGRVLIFIAFAGAFLGAQQEGPAADAERHTVVVIPMEGLIDRGLYDSLIRRIEEAREHDPALLVFKIDTYGGLVDAAIEITDEIGGIEEPKTVAFIPAKALSAGAMIAMGAREIVLTPVSSIGDAMPIAVSPEGPVPVGEKVESPTRAMFRKYAQRNSYPEALLEAMVTVELEVIEVVYEDGTVEYMLSGDFEGLSEDERDKIERSRTVVRQGEILTLTASEALQYGIARFVVSDMDELLSSYDLADAEVITLHVNWSEAMVRWLNEPSVASVILLLGILGIYMEFRVPGFGLPGTVGIVCFAIFFFSKHLSGMAGNLEILIFVMGIALLAVEIFVIPGFGITGFLGITLVFVSLALAFVPPNITTAPADIDYLAKAGTYFVAAMVGAIAIGAFLTRLLPHTPVVGKLYLGSPEPESVAHAEGAGLTTGKGDLLGKTGTAETPLRPAGRARIDGEYYDVTTQGDRVAGGEKIEVIKISGNNIIVRRVS